VLWGDEALASLWANSEAARKEYGDHHPLVRAAAVAEGRAAGGHDEHSSVYWWIQCIKLRTN
jgi:hypothetical protein